MQDKSFYSKYKYIRALGHGGCGEVFLAENITLGNLWAVKEITKGEKTSISGYIEPEILKRLNHPALPRICDVYEDETKLYIVEDYLEGTCLKQEFDAKGRFEEQLVIDWAIQLCSVLEYLHCQRPNPIIYGDMKPHNIILTKEGFVKLVDFGVSALASEDKGTKDEILRSKVLRSEIANDSSKASYDTAFIGTKGYAAPEQFIGKGISQASDIYSLGITLIQLVTGLDPLKAINMFENEKYAQYLSPELYEILRKCVHPNPELRYKNAGLLMNEIRQYSFSLHNGMSDENNLKSHKKSLDFTKIIAITGARGTGVSTMTAAMAEQVARGPTSVCIVDMSLSGRLGEGLSGRHQEGPPGKYQGSVPGRHQDGISGRHQESLFDNLEKAPPVLNENTNTTKLLKINSNLYYSNMNNLIDKIKSDSLLLHKQFAQLQDSFSYIFIDIDITLIKFIQQYLNHIFIVSDMNPFNAEDIGKLLKAEGIVAMCMSRTSFIINKYYKGELSSRNILQSMLLNGDAPQELQELLAYAKAFEVPYNQKVYFKWMYSFFGEPLNFKKLINDCFQEEISNIISKTILPEKRKYSRFARLFAY